MNGKGCTLSTRRDAPLPPNWLLKRCQEAALRRWQLAEIAAKGKRALSTQLPTLPLEPAQLEPRWCLSLEANAARGPIRKVSPGMGHCPLWGNPRFVQEHHDLRSSSAAAAPGKLRLPGRGTWQAMGWTLLGSAPWFRIDQEAMPHNHVM